MIEQKMEGVEAMDAGIAGVLRTCVKHNTAKVYGRELRFFRAWFVETGQSKLGGLVVRSYIRELERSGRGQPSVVNLCRAVLSKLAVVMAANGTISGTQAREIISFPREFYEPERIAQPLSSDDAKRLLSAPGAITIKGARDRAILAVILGCGLNLYECAQLHVADISKGGTVSAVDSGENRRVVPLPDWVKATIDAYMKMSGVSNGVLFRRSLRGDHLQNDPISYVSIGAVVREYADQIGLLVNSRDLRQTAVALSAQETADYKARIADLERETVSLRRALALKSNLPHDKLREVVVQYGERP